MFFKEKGFYISLVCGLAAIAAVAGLCMNLLGEEDEAPIAAASPTPIVTALPTPEAKETYSDTADDDEDMDMDSEVEETATPKPTKEAVETVTKPKKNALKFDQEAGLLWPVQGDILMEYSADRVVYFKTLAQYRTNPALVIGAKEGSDVKASADGVVTKVATSEETGRTVTMSIGNDFTVSYGQLKDVSVSQGDTVSEGQVIGKIAKPSKYYAEEGSNLYFQVKEKKKTVNPMLLLR